MQTTYLYELHIRDVPNEISKYGIRFSNTESGTAKNHGITEYGIFL
jgi:hypothetical protein